MSFFQTPSWKTPASQVPLTVPPPITPVMLGGPCFSEYDEWKKTSAPAPPKPTDGSVMIVGTSRKPFLFSSQSLRSMAPSSLSLKAESDPCFFSWAWTFRPRRTRQGQ